jgi:hypothetical protein
MTKTTRCQFVRSILADGPCTCHEIADTTGLSIRQARVIIWVLTSQKHAKIKAKLPREERTKGQQRRIYELTPRGRRLTFQREKQ